MADLIPILGVLCGLPSEDFGLCDTLRCDYAWYSTALAESVANVVDTKSSVTRDQSNSRRYE